MWDLFLPIHTNAYLKVENMPAIGFEIKRKCKVCGEVFLAKTLDSQYCSPKCSKVAWKRKKDAKEKNEKLNRLAQHIPDIREYVSVKEAVAMFGVERTTLYRLIKNGTVPAINVGKRLTINTQMQKHIREVNEFFSDERKCSISFGSSASLVWSFSAWLSSFRSMFTTTGRSNLMFPTWLVEFILETTNPLTIGISTENQWVCLFCCQF